MKWNEYARTGLNLQKAFRQQKYNGITRCDFAFNILECLKMDKDYNLVAVPVQDFLGGEYKLCAIPKEELKAYVQNDNQPSDIAPQESIWEHISIEKSEMGAWQACILDLSVAWMPLYWHGGYLAKKYIFSTNTLRSLHVTQWGNTSFDYRKFKDDPRITPKVTLQGDNVTIRYCYWNDWQGLVLCTDYAYFNDKGRLIYEQPEDDPDNIGKYQEILFEYNCGILF